VRAPEGHDVLLERGRTLQRDLASAGLSGVDIPERYGGRGLTHAHAEVIDEELSRYDAPSLRPLGIGMHLAVATLLASGSDEQRRRYLPALISADEQWCQLFSEPDAGSDLVSLRTRAIRDGDEWVINGQKVWSSFAAHAHFGLLLARTDPDAPKPQLGITMFVLPMHAPGVTVRPLVDIASRQPLQRAIVTSIRVDRRTLGAMHLGERSQLTLEIGPPAVLRAAAAQLASQSLIFTGQILQPHGLVGGGDDGGDRGLVLRAEAFD